MYVCGITPYDSTHLGHAATYLTYDLLIRRLEELGHEVRMVRNVTDVDDSILPKARELGVPVPRARRGRDGPLPLRHGRARDAAADRRAARDRVDRPASSSWSAGCSTSGHAYLTARHRRTSTCRRSRASASCRTTPDDQMVRLARARGGNPDDPHRRDPLDFVLWQPSLADEPAWRAPFGVGRPGWHIECSAMAMHEHGPTLDLHGGGTDLIFPHHECEIAQSESAHRRAVRRGTGCTRRWSSYEGEKMSKSLGNLVFVSDLLKIGRPARDPARADAPPLPLTASSGTTPTSTRAPRCCTGCSPRPSVPTVPTRARSRERVRDAIDDDLDAPRALDALDDLASAVLSGGDDPTAPAVLRELGALLGVDLDRPIARDRTGRRGVGDAPRRACSAPPVAVERDP